MIPAEKSERQPTMSFQVAARERNRIVVVDCVGRLTLSDSRTQLRDLVHVFTGNGRKKFLINLAGVDFVDSDGLGELTRCYSIVRRVGGEMKLVYVHKKVQALLELTRLINLFEIHSEEHVALQAFKEGSCVGQSGRQPPDACR
jgi:anti-sigma B factor antagonist